VSHKYGKNFPKESIPDGGFDYWGMYSLPSVNLGGYAHLPMPQLPDKIVISVVAPLYNRAPILESSLHTYLVQNFPKENYEIILIDDASTDNTREVAEQIIKKYPEYNIRFYFLNHTRTYNNIFGSNCGYKKSLGEIIMNTHMDVVISSNVFISAWKHLHPTWMPYLWLNPQHHGENPEQKQRFKNFMDNQEYDRLWEASIPWELIYHPPGFPTEFAGCVRKEHLMKIGGNDERIMKAPGDVDQWCRLQHGAGVIYGKDTSVKSVHRAFYSHRVPPANYKDIMSQRGVTWNPWDWQRNKGKDWGKMEPSEEASMIATPTMLSRL